MAETTQQNISLHIHNIFEEKKLIPNATNKKFLLVRQEGSREVQHNIDFYNLDMIISVGYRVKSLVATRFRIWATQFGITEMWIDKNEKVCVSDLERTLLDGLKQPGYCGGFSEVAKAFSIKHQTIDPQIIF